MKNLSKTINETVAEKMTIGEKEIVSQSMAQNALQLVETMEIKTQKDVLQFCAAMNLLNTYVKQKDNCMEYFFKTNINRLFAALQDNEISGVKIGMDIKITKKHKAIAYIIVQIEDVQFSFHQIKIENEAIYLLFHSNLISKLEFDGLRKQMCAVTVFDMAQAA